MPAVSTNNSTSKRDPFIEGISKRALKRVVLPEGLRKLNVEVTITNGKLTFKAAKKKKHTVKHK